MYFMEAKAIHDDLLPYIKGMIWEYRFLIKTGHIYELEFSLNGEKIVHYKGYGLKLMLELITKEKENET